MNRKELENKAISEKSELEKNIGKYVRIEHSSISGLMGREGIIQDVFGNNLQGYRYKVKLNESLRILKDEICYPRTSFCKILRN